MKASSPPNRWTFQEEFVNQELLTLPLIVLVTVCLSEDNKCHHLTDCNKEEAVLLICIHTTLNQILNNPPAKTANYHVLERCGVRNTISPFLEEECLFVLHYFLVCLLVSA